MHELKLSVCRSLVPPGKPDGFPCALAFAMRGCASEVCAAGLM
jgi:hypothetical protein